MWVLLETDRDAALAALDTAIAKPPADDPDPRLFRAWLRVEAAMRAADGPAVSAALTAASPGVDRAKDDGLRVAWNRAVVLVSARAGHPDGRAYAEMYAKSGADPDDARALLALFADKLAGGKK